MGFPCIEKGAQISLYNFYYYMHFSSFKFDH